MGLKQVNDTKKAVDEQVQKLAAQYTSTKPSTGTLGYQGSYYSSRANCHTSGTRVFAVEKPSGGVLEIHAGRIYAAGDHHDLIIDLTGGSPDPVMRGWNLPPGLQKLADRYHQRTLSIRWPDYGTPKIDGTDWYDLATELLEDDSLCDIYLGCQGGHGRTGTALTILGVLLGAFDEHDDPDRIFAVRDRYCQNAVESLEQVEYIEQITGIVLDASAAAIVEEERSYAYRQTGYYQGGTGGSAGWQSTVYGGKREAEAPKGGGSGKGASVGASVGASASTSQPSVLYPDDEEVAEFDMCEVGANDDRPWYDDLADGRPRLAQERDAWDDGREEDGDRRLSLTPADVDRLETLLEEMEARKRAAGEEFDRRLDKFDEV